MLQSKGAKEFTKGACEMLTNFLNREQDLPIVAHGVKYDRDAVLNPAFQRVWCSWLMPSDERWVCTYELARQRTDLVPRPTPKGLDSLLGHFGLEQRDPEAKHDAYIDCIKTAQLYMKLKAPTKAEISNDNGKNSSTGGKLSQSESNVPA